MHNDGDPFVCPYCGQTLTVDGRNNCKRFYPSFEHEDWYKIHQLYSDPKAYGKTGLIVSIYECIHCKNYSVEIIGCGDQYNGKEMMFYPSTKAKQYPDYVPKAIRSDYEEAYAILSLSPKASATLSRRCVQGMIRDAWGTSEKTLFKEIDAIKDKVEPSIYKALTAIRQLGNIGAHMESDVNLIVDIDEGEAEKLLKLVELLIKNWYIDPHESQELIDEIVNISAHKREIRQH